MTTDGVMLSLYPDSIGGKLADIARLLETDAFRNAFSYLYVLPSIFRHDLDRGFSVVSYDLNEELATSGDLERIRSLGISLKLDIVLNHLSAQSPQFLDLLEHGDDSEYAEFFIDWNRFWHGYGQPGRDGYVIPRETHLSKLFMRKPGLPVLRVPFPDGSDRFYWNTFYQQADGPTILGQVDLNAESEKTWQFYANTLGRLAGYGAGIVRLDAFAYLHKRPGLRNFLNEPGTWEYLERLTSMADTHGIQLLPEIHSTYDEGAHEKLAAMGFLIYDFFFPVLLLDAIETGQTTRLVGWMQEVRSKGFRTINMLGCHDGIPILDVKGLMDDEQVQRIMKLITRRGGRLKNLFGPDGKEIAYYQVNATYFSALGEDTRKMLLARALQMFAPGIPQVWYLDLFEGKNDYRAADSAGHKEINRTNLSMERVAEALLTPSVQTQIELLRFRNSHPAFGFQSDFSVEEPAKGEILIRWSRNDAFAELHTDLNRLSYSILDGGS